MRNQLRQIRGAVGARAAVAKQAAIDRVQQFLNRLLLIVSAFTVIVFVVVSILFCKHLRPSNPIQPAPIPVNTLVVAESAPLQR